MQDLLQKIVADESYQANLDWGKPRRGHAEATVRAHVAELEENLDFLRPRLSEDAYWKLKLLIHVHDSFKAEATRGVPITHPRSHASLARAFLARFCQDTDLLNMVQYHDEGHALWRGFQSERLVNAGRLSGLVSRIQDWDLFLAFCVIDSCTFSKERDSIRWFVAEIGQRVPVSVTTDWIKDLDRCKSHRLAQRR
jgi:hypothetical protein